MASIIVLFPKIEDAKSIRNLLMRSGFQVDAVCTSGTQALQYMDALNSGVVICGYKFKDMIYSTLHSCMPPHFQMLLVASQHLWSGCTDNDIVCLAMPIKAHDLINTVKMMTQEITRQRKKRRSMPNKRSAEENKVIEDVKKVLVERNNMTEEEAHRYIQKCSMESGNNLVETAQMVLSIIQA